MPRAVLLQRRMVAQADSVTRRLAATSGAPDAQTVHAVRKDLKRLRAELLLLEDHVGHKRTRREDRILARAGDALARPATPR